MTDGGPAFPFEYFQQDSEYGPGGPCAHPGMSLRDWYAGMALMGMGTWMPLHRLDGTFVGEAPDLSIPRARAARAEWAYAQADAMLAEREKSSG